MYLIDSHCHIHDKETYEFALGRQQAGKKLRRELEEKFGHYPLVLDDYQPEKVLDRALENNVKKMITIGTSEDDSRVASEFAKNYENVFWTFGIHPDEASKVDLDSIDFSIIKSQNAPVAIGEFGLDYRNGEGDRKEQIKLFECLLQVAQDENLPCIFHVREAFDDFFAVLDNFSSVKNGVVHSYSDSQKNLEKSLDRGFFIGINGLFTFADLPVPPLSRVMLETDAPFLSPVPYRGITNEPARIKDIAEFLANKYRVTVEDVAEITTNNSETLFDI